MKDTEVIVCCIRKEKMSEEEVVAGSTTVKCVRCDEECWQSPDTTELLAAIICDVCLPSFLKFLNDSNERWAIGVTEKTVETMSGLM